MRCATCNAVVKPETELVVQILDAVAKEHVVDVKAIRGRSQIAHIVRARDCAAMRLRRDLDLHLKTIGFYLGGRDHSTILTAIRRAERNGDD
jgi:chromosomal replication initiator protein